MLAISIAPGYSLNRTVNGTSKTLTVVDYFNTAKSQPTFQNFTKKELQVPISIRSTT